MTDDPKRAPVLGGLLEPFLEHRVDFVVIGGMAGLAHGSSYPSFDLDLAYSRDRANLDRLVGALTQIGVALRGPPPDLPFVLDRQTLESGANFTFRTLLGDLDVLSDVAGIRSYVDLKARSKIKFIGGVEAPVASIDDLIAMKRAAGRPKDERMLEDYLVIADEQTRQSPGGAVGGSDRHRPQSS